MRLGCLAGYRLDDRARALQSLGREGKRLGIIFDHPGRLLVCTAPIYGLPAVAVALMPERPSPFDDGPALPTTITVRKVYLEAEYIQRRRARLYVYAHCPADMEALMDFCRAGDA